MFYKKLLIAVCVMLIGFAVYKVFAAKIEMEGDAVRTEKHIDLVESTAPTTPPTGYGRLYVKSDDSQLYFKDDSGNEHNLIGVDWKAKTPKMAYHKNTTIGIETVLDIPSGSGYLIGIMMGSYTYAGYLKVTIDGTVLLNEELVVRNHASGLAFMHRFNNSLKIEARCTGANYLWTTVSYVLD